MANDLAMLQTGYSIAMGNAHPNLKAVADFVTGTNDEDGILQAVQRMIAAVVRTLKALIL